MGFKVSQKFKVFTDIDGDPLNGGFIYIGEAGKDPKTNPITPYIDRNLAVFINQPIRTNGGYPIYNDDKTDIYVGGDYSIIVEDKNGANIYTSLNDNNTEVYGSGLKDVDALRAFPGVYDEDVIKVYGLASFGDGNGREFYWDSASTATDDGATIIQPTGVTVGRWLVLQLSLSSVVQDTTPQLGGPLDSNGHIIQESKGTDIASAATISIPTDGNYFAVTGTNNISAINTTGVIGTSFTLRFSGILTLTHNATSLVLPGSADITTADGDIAEFVEYSAGNFRCTNYSNIATPPYLSAVVDDTTPQLGGALDANSNTFNASSYRQVTDASLGTGTYTFDYSVGDMQQLTATGDITIAFSSFVAGKVCSFVIDAINWGAHTITLPAGLLFTAGTPPTFTTAGTDRVVVIKDKDDVYSLFVVGQDIKVV